MSVDGNLRLLCITSSCDWLMQLVAYTERIRGKHKINRDLLTLVLTA